MKKALFSFAVICILSFTYFNNGYSYSVASYKSPKALKSVICYDNFRYERVNIAGVWWIFVYDLDGNLVNIYEDEE